jgi:hypothetical protein
VIKHAASVMRGYPLLAVSWGLVLGIAASAGWGMHYSRVTDCTKVVGEIGSLKSKKWPNDAELAMREIDRLSARVEKGAGVCNEMGMTTEGSFLGLAKSALVESKNDVTRMASEERNRLAEEERQVRNLKAQGELPNNAKQVGVYLENAKKVTAQQNWIAADDNLGKALALLQELDNLPAEVKTHLPADFDLQKKEAEVLGLRLRIGGLVAQAIDLRDRAESKRAADEAAVSAATATRGQEPSQDVDGCCIECKQYLKQVMNDPDSYECVRATLPQIEGEYWTVVMRYRGKNGFGAMTLETRKFFIQGGQVAKTDP